MADLNLGQAASGSRLAGQGDVPRIRLDQNSADVATAAMVCQYSDDVVTLPGAQADQLDPTRGRVTVLMPP